jgi:hypothetical protein
MNPGPDQHIDQCASRRNTRPNTMTFSAAQYAGTRLDNQ